MAGVTNKSLKALGRGRAKLLADTGHGHPKNKAPMKYAKGGGVKQRGHGAARKGFTSRGPMG